MALVWNSLHNERWIRDDGWGNIKEILSFEDEVLYNLQEFRSLQDSLNIKDRRDLCYAFDVSVRQLTYGKKVGDDNPYITHRIREINFPNMTCGQADPTKFSVRFGPCLTEIAQDLTVDEYALFLHIAREFVSDNRKYWPPSDKDLKDLSIQLGLRLRFPSLSKYTFWLSMVAGVADLTILKDQSTLVKAGIVVGAPIAIQAVDTFMSKAKLPKLISDRITGNKPVYRWMRAICESPLEKHGEPK